MSVDPPRREDAELYPELRGCAKTRELADTCASKMPGLSRGILAFARGFGKVMGTLNKRRTREELRLYPDYARQCTDMRKAGLSAAGA